MNPGNCTVTVLLLFTFVALVLSQSNPKNLLLAQTLTRHGDRVAGHAIKADPATWICSVNTIAPWTQDGISEYIAPPAQLYRAVYLRDRSSLLGNCTEGQLTLQGVNQTYNLGKQLAEEYKSNYDFLPIEYSSKDVYVRSSQTDRCQQSARNLLTGMYQPLISNQSLVVPIHLIEKEDDNMQLNIKRCPRVLLRLVDTLLHSKEARRNLIQPLIPFLPQLKRVFNTTHPFGAAFYNFDNCNCRKSNDIPLPNGMSNAMFNAIQKSYWWGGQLLFNSSSDISVGSFVAELVDFMDRKIAGDLTYKFQLFSSHDTGVGPFLCYFGVYDGNWPPYVSHIQLNLYEDSGEHFVQFWFNDVLQVIPACGVANCPYATFRSIALANVPEDPEKACELFPLNIRPDPQEPWLQRSSSVEDMVRQIYADVDIPLIPGEDSMTVVEFALMFANLIDSLN